MGRLANVCHGNGIVEFGLGTEGIAVNGY
jgi:hypothetical protein